ncbi:MAG: dTDP-4-dehydrorhamnose reductase [Dokdonella sp.]|uniref:dTDP-4-dehydrorhamnose reductase n=1 Tax=Dokdonella sp. TaxID=2291710 RepID=UPI0025BF5946|nr:dTDP-4-dehydrorhamnose reductase [Dokdonella sp.]MBX3701198.1 dTDP-4-dehydrorhamnose reductase [Dokdonella sp.]
MRILLLGANGQVGHELRTALAPLGDVLAASRDGLLTDGTRGIVADLADAASLRGALAAAQAALIVNAAACTAVDRAEDEPQLAARINHHAVAEIGGWAAAHGARVIHYSTDYVFDGHAATPYREEAATAPLGVYGRSKLAGEHALRDSGAAHLILRTAWVYAARGHNFLRTMLRLAGERDELRVVADQIGAPTPAHWIAGTTAQLMPRWDGQAQTLHLVAGGQASWYEFAAAIIASGHARGLLARAPRVVPIPSLQYPTRAQRPAWSVLDCTRLKTRFGLELPDWKVGLDEVLAQLATNAVP